MVHYCSDYRTLLPIESAMKSLQDHIINRSVQLRTHTPKSGGDVMKCYTPGGSTFFDAGCWPLFMFAWLNPLTTSPFIIRSSEMACRLTQLYLQTSSLGLMMRHDRPLPYPVRFSFVSPAHTHTSLYSRSGWLFHRVPCHVCV